jgi:hypothetical protein
MKRSTICNLALFIGLVAMVAPACRAQSQLVGEWLGIAKDGDTQLRIGWHVAAASDGSITSTIDNLDQELFGLPVNSMTVKGDALTLTLDTVRVVDGNSINIRGTFTGTINAEATEIHGSWFQGQVIQLDLKRVSLQAALNAVAQAQLAGDWQGAINAMGTQLRLVLHIAAGKDGVLTATLDSVDQGAYGIPVSAIALKGAKLSLAVDDVHGTYEGTMNKDATEIDGTWLQGMPLELNFRRVLVSTTAATPAPKPAPPTEIDGSWTGTLDAGTTKLRIIFTIVNTQDGLTAKMQSPDQSPVWVTATSVTRSGSLLIVEMTTAGITYQGKIGDDLASINGTFTQSGSVQPLVLQKMKE